MDLKILCQNIANNPGDLNAEQLEDKFLEFAKLYNEEIRKYEDEVGVLDIPDIRNKLTPITHLISTIEMGRDDLIKGAIPQAKKSVNYLAKRDVYKL